MDDFDSLEDTPLSSSENIVPSDDRLSMNDWIVSFYLWVAKSPETFFLIVIMIFLPLALLSACATLSLMRSMDREEKRVQEQKEQQLIKNNKEQQKQKSKKAD